MDPSDVISTSVALLALGVSLVVTRDTRRRQQEAERLARQPALVFEWDGSSMTWFLRNIGNGPALDVVIVQRTNADWVHPLRMPEMSVDGSETVPRRWLERWSMNPGLGARYRSITGEAYVTRTGDDRSEISRGSTTVPVDKAAIEPHWQYRTNRGSAQPRDSTSD